MDLISTPLAIALVAVGAAAMAMATVVARREPLPKRTGRPGRLALLVPWAGSVLVVVLLVRGAVAGAVVVAVATLLHAAVMRARASGEGGGR